MAYNGKLPEGLELRPLNFGRAKTLQLIGLRLARHTGLLEQTEDYEAWEAQFNLLMRDLQKIIASAIVSVPREWLSHDAPKELDWNDPDSLEWVLNDKVEIISSLIRGDKADETAGN